MALAESSLPYPSLTLALLAVVVVVVLLLLLDVTKPRRFPPGPAWLPVVGAYPLLRRLVDKHGFLHEVWRELAARYGPVLGLRLGRDLVVVASGLAAVHEVLRHADFDGRPDGFFFRLRCFGERLGIVFTEGEHWQEQRRFSLRQLLPDLEAHVVAEAAELVGALRSSAAAAPARPVPMCGAFDVSVLNVLWAKLDGRRFRRDDARLAGLLRTLHDCFRETDVSGGLLNQMPFLRFVAPDRCGYTNTLRNLRTLWGFLEETVAEHKQDPTTPRGLIDAFLEMQQNGEGSGNFSEKQLLSLLLDLFMAGAETTSNTLGFCVMFLLQHPEVQRRAQDELDRVVGRHRDPCLKDRHKLNYLKAVLMETQRLGNIAPVGVPHRAVRNARIRGDKDGQEFVVPKGTIVLANLMSVHMDRDHWGDPERFRPERFLDETGSLKPPTKYFLPFGVGRRSCLGERLARSSLFLFAASLLHHFTLSPSPEHPIGERHFLDGFTLSPKPLYAVLTPRDLDVGAPASAPAPAGGSLGAGEPA
ncbi:Methyl farnesoate epoxidase [Frankliniella fusca]|uniref:Methyl farnesoate epoxidase n=1 Tax=Frankliniella fusca TaxID=407009 RepID=A0AAE1LGD6_9NEOP|nr:Methyl farnesoate epoxidase [Frankliniella fusca]